MKTLSYLLYSTFAQILLYPTLSSFSYLLYSTFAQKNVAQNTFFLKTLEKTDLLLHSTDIKRDRFKITRFVDSLLPRIKSSLGSWSRFYPPESLAISKVTLGEKL